MAGSVVSEVTDGPVLNLMNKRLRALRKKYNRIIQMEEGIALGKPINKEQEEVLRSKPVVVALIDEYEKLRQPLSNAVKEEINLSIQNFQVSATTPVLKDKEENGVKNVDVPETGEEHLNSGGDGVIENLLNLLYFGNLFDVKPQSDFTSMMLTKTHERGCCLTYDYVTDDVIDLLGERDLDMISMVGGLLTSRPVHSGLSHKNALQSCINHAKLWLSNSDQPIEPGTTITYAELRKRLNKILESDYITTAPDMKAPVEVAAAAAGKYTVPVDQASVQLNTEIVFTNNHEDEQILFQEHETGADHSRPIEEPAKDEYETPNQLVVTSVVEEENKQEDVMEHNQRDTEWKEKHYMPRRNYQNQRGGGRGSSGGGGRRGSNVRGGRSSRGGSGGGKGSYQNGRSQYYDQPENYYPRSHYNTRGGGKGAGGHGYSNHGSAYQDGHAQGGIEMGS